MSTEGINGTSQMWARALIRQSPGSSAQGRLRAGAWDRKDHPHAELWAPMGDGADPPQVADCCPVHVLSWYSKGCQSSNPLTERPEGPGPDVQH